MVARKFNQSTQFGAMLDMTIDRCTTACLLVFLAAAYPTWSILFQGLISLDFASHYMHVYATLMMGAANQSHKKIGQNRPWAMKIYYSNLVCHYNYRYINMHTLANMLIECAFYSLSIQRALFYRSLPLLFLRQRGNTDPGKVGLLPLVGYRILTICRTEPVDTFILRMILYVSGAFMLFKQYVNVIQMIEACKWIAEGDVERRKEMNVRRQKLQ
jgi:CDP-diacylglycerol--inositol 3-phosphatidyltransferase